MHRADPDAVLAQQQQGGRQHAAEADEMDAKVIRPLHQNLSFFRLDLSPLLVPQNGHIYFSIVMHPYLPRVGMEGGTDDEDV